SDEELAISRSTPAARFDAPAPAPAPTPTPQMCAVRPSALESEFSPDVAAFVAAAIDDREQPIVMFALEWCEFCWAVRKLFAKCGLSYRSIDLDSAAYQRDDRGGQIRAVLRGRTGSRTIPQVFVAGRFVGGCTETFDAFRSGQLQALLAQRGIEVRP